MNYAEINAAKEADRMKIAMPAQGPALQSAEAIYRFLDNVGLLPFGIRASTPQKQVDAINILRTNGWTIDVHTLDQALANTTLSSFGRMMTKARLGEVGFLAP